MLGHNLGRLGNGSIVDQPKAVDAVAIDAGVVFVSSGNIHTCALLTDGSVACCGSNRDGQLALGATPSVNVLRPLTGFGATVKNVAAGGAHTCVVTDTEQLWCWGYNGDGEFGNGFTGSTTSPVAVGSADAGLASLVAGDKHTCALMNDSTVNCWGINASGELGDGTNTQRLTPVRVSGLSAVTQLATSGSPHLCAIELRRHEVLGQQHVRSARRWHDHQFERAR